MTASWTVLATLASVMAISVRATAQEARPIRLDYQGDGECLDPEAFVHAVRNRTSLASFDADAGAGIDVTVRIRLRGGEAIGIVTMDGGPPRQVQAATCAEAVSALAFIVAVSLDPLAISGSTGSLAEGAVPPAGSAASTTGTDGSREGIATAEDAGSLAPTGASPPTPAGSEPSKAGATPLPTGSGTGPSKAAEAPPPTPRAKTESGRSFRRSWSAFEGLGARAEASGLGSPAIHLFGAAAFVELGIDTGSVFSPGVRLYGAYAASPTVTVDHAPARFTLLTGGIELLPLRFKAGRLEVVPGMVAELGTISGTGEPSQSFTAFPSRRRPWFALGEEVAVRIAVAGPFYAGLTFELAEPLRRYTFFFSQNPDVTLADVPSVATVAALEAGLHFL